MFKYTFVPNKEYVAAEYMKHTEVDIFENGDFDFPITLVVIANSEEECKDYRIKVTNIDMWELSTTEEL